MFFLTERCKCRVGGERRWFCFFVMGRKKTLNSDIVVKLSKFRCPDHSAAVTIIFLISFKYLLAKKIQDSTVSSRIPSDFECARFEISNVLFYEPSTKIFFPHPLLLLVGQMSVQPLCPRRPSLEKSGSTRRVANHSSTATRFWTRTLRIFQ